MQKNIFLLLLTVLSLSINAQNNKEPYEQRSLSNQEINAVTLQTQGGFLKVLASPSAETRLEVYIEGNNDSRKISHEEIKSWLQEYYDLTIGVSNNKLTAIAKQKSGIGKLNPKKTLSISFVAYVPKEVSSNLLTSGGSIHLTGISGAQDFATSGGSLHIMEVSGQIKGRTSGGSIQVENSSDNIDLITSGGSITASNCTGKIRLNTSAGKLRLTDLKGDIKVVSSGGGIEGDRISGDLTATTSGGSIRLNNLEADLETSTSGGSIDVSFATLKNKVTIRNSGGSISLELPEGKGLDLDISAQHISTGNLGSFTGKSTSESLRGTLNGGGVPVMVRSGAGSVTLKFK